MAILEFVKIFLILQISFISILLFLGGLRILTLDKQLFKKAHHEIMKDIEKEKILKDFLNRKI